MKNYVSVPFSIFLLFLPITLLAQELPEVIPPSPTVANLMQFEEVPISYYTGQPNISIPIYSKQINSDLTLNFDLSYNTQGVKINNRSGWTGTGWSLNAGGTISRTVRGLPDEWEQNAGTLLGTGVFHNLDFWNYDTLSSNQKQEFLWNSGGTTSEKYDHELDLFQFNALGVTGRFIIVREGNALVPKLLSKDQNIKIIIDYNTQTYALNKFIIVDTKGYIYTFDVKEEVHSEPFTAVEYFDENQIYSGSNGDYVSVNAWHLSSIEMPNSVNGNLSLVDFTYQTSGESYTASVSRTESRVLNPPNPTWNNLISVEYNASITKPKKVYSYFSTTVGTKKLSQVTFKDGTYLEFNTHPSKVHPETNGEVLDYIRIKDSNGNENQHYKFNYDTNTIATSRLWLNSISQVAGSIDLDYTFEYIDKYDLPNFDTVSETDNWGYNKGAQSLNCGLEAPNNTAIKKGLLSRIIYPTGGIKEFEFERHTITYQGNAQLSDDDYRDKNPDNWLPQQLSLSYNSATDNSAQNSSIPPDTFTVYQAQEISYRLISTAANTSEQFNAYIEVLGPNNFREVFRLTENEAKFTVDQGQYEVRFYTLDIGTSYAVSACIGYKNFTSTINRYIYGGGVRIKNIKFKNDPSSTNHEKYIVFDYNEDGTQNKSSGSIDGLLTGLVKTYTESVTRHMISEICPLYEYGPIQFQFEVTTTGLNAELTKGQYVGYKKVKAYEPLNGYTEYTYTSSQNYYSPPATFIYPYAPVEDLDYKRGLLLNSTVYDEAEQKLKETINTYAFEEDVIAPSYNFYSHDNQWKMFYNHYSDMINGFPEFPMNLCKVPTVLGACNGDCITNYPTNGSGVPYFFISNDVKATWVKLTQIQNKEYFYDSNNNQSVTESRQEFLYNPNNYQISQQDSYYDVAGIEENLQLRYYYPEASLNSNSASTRNMLINLNKVNEVLETQTFRNNVKISEQRTIYHEFFTNVVLPKEVQVAKENESPETRIEFVTYDTFGNPTEVKKSNGVSICYIYGFNNSLPVAKISNASYSAINSISNNGLNSPGNLTATNESNLRAGLPNAFISFYRYEPFKGVVSTADDNSYEMTYEYDAFNRLIRVKDAQGNITGENSYNYKHQY